MPTTVQCPNPACGRTSPLSDRHLGRPVRCRHCGTRFTAVPTVDAPCVETTVVQPLPDRRPPDVPATVGRFVVRAVLGSGAFGTVYRAHDPQLDREVAVKVPRPGTLNGPQRVERFLREAKAAARLKHPNIVPVYDAGQDGATYYIAAGFIDGKPLADEIDAGRVEFRRAARLVRRLAEAVAAAHRAGVVHRDIKPDNVLLDADGEPHLTDFGLAACGDTGERLTRDGAVMGTPAYMAPEHAAGQQGEAQPASDQYSLGVVLYELLTGRVPFSGPPAVVLANAMHFDPPPPRSLRPYLPAELEAICLKAMAKKPKDRYADCQAFADDLGRWLDKQRPEARPAGTATRLARWSRRHPAVAAVAALPVVALLGALAWFVAKPRETTPVATNTPPPKQPVEVSPPNPVELAQKKLAAAIAGSDGGTNKAPTVVSQSPPPPKPKIAWPQVAASTVASARANLAAGNYEAAADGASQVISFDPGVASAWEVRALARMGQKRYDEAAADFGECLKRQANPAARAAILVQRAKANKEAGRADDAIADCTEAQKLDPSQTVAALALRGLAHDAKGDTAAALQDYNAILDADLPSGRRSNFGRHYLERAGLYAKLGDVGNARRDRDKALALTPALAEDALAKTVDAILGTPPEPVVLTATAGTKLLKERSRYLGHTPNNAVRSVAVTPNWDRALTSSVDQLVQSWNPKTLRPNYSIRHSSDVHALAISPDGREAAFAGGFVYQDGKWTTNGEYTITVINAVTGTEIGRLRGHTAPVRSLAFLPAGKQLLSCGNDRTARLWDLERRLCIRVYEGHTGFIECLDASSDGRFFVTCGEDTSALLWDIEQTRPIRPYLGHSKTVIRSALSPDARSLLTASLDKTVRLWDVSSGRQLAAYLHPTGLSAVRWLPDGRRALTASGHAVTEEGGWYYASHDHCIRLIDIRTVQVLAQIDGFFVAQNMQIDRDGTRAAIVGNNGNVRILELPRWEPPR